MTDGPITVAIGGVVMSFAPGTSVSIGRNPDSTIVVDGDLRVARHHLTLDCDGVNGWVATDLDTGWGTWCNGQRIQRMAVTHDVEVRLAHPLDGPVLTFRHGAVPAAAPTGPQPPVSGGERLGGSIRAIDGPGSFSVVRSMASGVTRIGRDDDNDIVLADDLTVSRHHAELHRHADHVEIVDVGSKGGTFVDGARVQRAVVADGAVVAIGRHLFVLREGELGEFIDDSAGLVVDNLTVAIDGRNLVDDINIAVEPGHVVAVVGPTGAGKSTLLKALTGFQPATAGQVLYNGRDLYATIDELRRRIGYVPQDDILHVQLPLRAALRYSAELRFAADTSNEERDQRVDEVLAELGLTERATLPISKLSGGQRKRASVALELLTRPALLFLDEPTSGLDPGYERSVMELLRELADGGRTVFVITHAVASLDLCDRVLFLAPGGHMAYYGPPADALAHFGADDYAEVFRRLDAERRDWAGELKVTPAYERYVTTPAARLRRAAPAPQTAAPPAPAARPAEQVPTLVRRNLAVLIATRGYALLLLAQAPVIAVLLLMTLKTGNFGGAPITGRNLSNDTNPRALILVVITSACAMGLVNACREIVKELPIYQRERTVGLSLQGYLLSKFMSLALLALVQATVFTLIVLLPQDPSADPLLLGSVTLELGVIVFFTTLASVGLGLAVSAMVSTDSAALVLIPVLIVGQLILGGAVLNTSGPGLAQLSWASPSHWGFSASAASVDLLSYDQRCAAQKVVPKVTVNPDDAKKALGDVSCGPGWDHDTVNLAGAVFGLLVLTVGYGLVAAWALRRRDPLRLIHARAP